MMWLRLYFFRRVAAVITNVRFLRGDAPRTTSSDNPAVGKKRGSAVVALMLVALIILGSMLMLHTSAVLTIGGTSRALEIARQNSATAVRLERTTREAAQSVFGQSPTAPERGFQDELRSMVESLPLGSVELSSIEVVGAPIVPRGFPHPAGEPAPLHPRSDPLELLCTPELMAYAGPRVAESDNFEVRYRFKRPAVKSSQTYSLGVKCRLVAVPLSRFGVMPYDLPDEIGREVSAGISSVEGTAAALGPRGLVPARDSANVPDLATGAKRPGYFRYAAALSETYQYIFSKTYLQSATDYAGATHFVQIGAGSANPSLNGGSEVGKTYTLDVGSFGDGALGAKTATKDLAVFYATSDGCTLVLTDSGGGTSPILLVIAGPASSAVGPLTLQLPNSLQRPIVLVCYNTQVNAPADCQVNGALVLDRDCAVSAIGPITVGHASYWAGSSISPNTFRVGAMPLSAENLMPRAIYVATAKAFF